MTTGTYKVIAQAGDSTLETKYLSMKWSPDSLSYAFTYMPSDADSYDEIALVVYSIETRTLASIDTILQQNLPTDLAWSDDSCKLAFITRGPSNSVRIFDLCNSDPYISISSGFFLPDVEAALKLCQTMFSPDTRYLAFQGGCIDMLQMLPTEIYFWDTTYNPERGQVIQQVTHNAPYSLVADDPALYPFISYDPIWIDNQHLLVGSSVLIYRYDVGIFEETYRQETRLYNVATGETELISTDRLGQWAHNPAKNLWAYQRFPTATEFAIIEEEQPDRSVASKGQRWPDSPPSSVEISTFDGQTFTPLMVAPSASTYVDSKLYWSPDGRFLAYTGIQQDGTSAVILVDITTKEIQAFDSLWISGWVIAPVDQNPDRG